MKRFSAAALCLALVACATPPTSSAPGFYRPKGADSQHQITGQLSPADAFSTSRSVTILIDGDLAAAGRIESDGGQIAGAWRGRRVESDCSMTGGPWTGLTAATLSLVGADRPGVRCLVFIDGERAASLVMAR